jgi:hypothetical protein
MPGRKIHIMKDLPVGNDGRQNVNKSTQNERMTRSKKFTIISQSNLVTMYHQYPQATAKHSFYHYYLSI